MDLATFDGNGNFIQEDFVLTNGEPPADPFDSDGFNDMQSGPYTVNADCTSIFTISSLCLVD